MTCDEAIEHLPWLLNGTLEPEEQRQVREHLAGCAACSAALAETRAAGRIFAQHLPTESLVAYAGGDCGDRGC